MKIVSVDKAKNNFSQLIAAAEAGEEVLIRRGRHAVVRLVAIDRARPKRQFGALAGKLTLTSAFFDPLSGDELSDWER